METLSLRAARRLALARAGLLKPAWTGLPSSARGRGRTAREAALAVIRRFGYLQLDSVPVSGARSHAIVLLSRLRGLDVTLGEELLRPGVPIFEYWGHEASWIPIELYPDLAFRRREFRHHPWWGDLIGKHPRVARSILERIRIEGPLKPGAFGGKTSTGWWDLGVANKVAEALWSRGDLAVRERKNFHRTFDLAERVIPEEWRCRRRTRAQGLETLIRRALEGHGFASTTTVVNTWRLNRYRREVEQILIRLERSREVRSCQVMDDQGRRNRGWILIEDLDLAARLETVRPRKDRGVLLSPFDPVLWDRERVRRLFDFDAVLEIYKPAPRRIYGYYCLPILAGESLVGRVDLKADRKNGVLRIRALHFGGTGGKRKPTPAESEAARHALDRFASALELTAT